MKEVEELTQVELADELEHWRKTYPDMRNNYDARLLHRAADAVRSSGNDEMTLRKVLFMLACRLREARSTERALRKGSPDPVALGLARGNVAEAWHSYHDAKEIWLEAKL